MRKVIYALMLVALPAFAGRGEKALEAVSVSSFEESFTIEGPQLDSMYGACTEDDWDTCKDGCIARGQGYPILQWSCSIGDDGRARCGCVFIIPGPYNPPCYWNCHGTGANTRQGQLH